MGSVAIEVSDDASKTRGKDESNESETLENDSEKRMFGLELPFYIQFGICVIGIFGTYLPHGFIQESLFKSDNFAFPLFLTFVQFVIYVFIGFAERRFAGEVTVNAPYSSYGILALCISGSLTFSNMAILHLNYPTKVVFKSSKIIPMMIVGRLYFQKKYDVGQYVATSLLLSGVILFSLTDANVSPSFHWKGILFMLLSVTSEALGQNYQEYIMTTYKSTEREVLFFNAIFSAMIVATMAFFTGEMIPAFNFCLQNPNIYHKILLMSMLGYVGTLLFLMLTKSFGSFVSMTVTTARKFFTVILSFILFPKPVVINYVFAILLTFSGLGLNVFLKSNRPKKEMELETPG